MTDLHSSMPATGAVEPQGNGSGPCVAGLCLLVVGVFLMGIPAGLTAISLGRRGARRGATTFGTVVQVLGWIEVVGTALLLMAVLGSQ